MLALAPFAFLGAIASPQPAAPLPAGLGPEWVAMPTATGQVAHYERPSPHGPADQLLVSKAACQCLTSDLFDTLSSGVLDLEPNAIVDRSTDTACGRTVQHLLMTGVADGVQHHNVDVYAYRTTDSLVVITYAFSKAAPTSQDEAAMRAVCPPD